MKLMHKSGRILVYKDEKTGKPIYEITGRECKVVLQFIGNAINEKRCGKTKKESARRIFTYLKKNNLLTGTDMLWVGMHLDDYKENGEENGD
jgi:hypothetical protein